MRGLAQPFAIFAWLSRCLSSFATVFFVLVGCQRQTFRKYRAVTREAVGAFWVVGGGGVGVKEHEATSMHPTPPRQGYRKITGRETPGQESSAIVFPQAVFSTLLGDRSSESVAELLFRF